MFNKHTVHVDGTTRAATGYINEETGKRVIKIGTVHGEPGSGIVVSVDVVNDDSEAGVRAAIKLLEDMLDEYRNRLVDRHFTA